MEATTMKGKSDSFGNVAYPGRANSGYYDFKNNIHPHNLPIKHIPNSSITQKDDNGKTIRIRYYDDKGNVYKDVVFKVVISTISSSRVSNIAKRITFTFHRCCLHLF